MAPYKKLDLQQLCMVVAKVLEGNSYWDVENSIGINWKIVSAIMSKNSLADLPRAGRLHKTTSSEDSMLFYVRIDHTVSKDILAATHPLKPAFCSLSLTGLVVSWIPCSSRRCFTSLAIKRRTPKDIRTRNGSSLDVVYLVSQHVADLQGNCCSCASV